MDPSGLYAKLPPDIRIIRLLRILPKLADTSETDEIHCELHTSSLWDAKGHYRALSYTWSGGDNTGPQPYVYCNQAIVNVTHNLYEALHRLRGSREAVELWVDFLCINQADDEERTHQVGMMRDIYSHCSEVIIWLGAGGLGNSRELEDVRFHGDERDLPMVQRHMQHLMSRNRNGPLEARDFYGAFCLLSMLAMGMVASKIWYMRNLDYAPSTISGLNDLLERSWVSLARSFPLSAESNLWSYTVDESLGRSGDRRRPEGSGLLQ